MSISILQISLDSSNIIYFKKDDETDDDIPRENTCLFFRGKKFKRDQFSKTASPTKNIKLPKNLNKRCISKYKYLRQSSNYHNNVGKRIYNTIEIAFNEIWTELTFSFFLRIQQQ